MADLLTIKDVKVIGQRVLTTFSNSCPQPIKITNITVYRMFPQPEERSYLFGFIKTRKEGEAVIITTYIPYEQIIFGEEKKIELEAEKPLVAGFTYKINVEGYVEVRYGPGPSFQKEITITRTFRL